MTYPSALSPFLTVATAFLLETPPEKDSSLSLSLSRDGEEDARARSATIPPPVKEELCLFTDGTRDGMGWNGMG